jgi:hypothetical protein
MTIGPEPMTGTLLMSERLGMVKKNSDPKWLSDNYSFKRNAHSPSKI